MHLLLTSETMLLTDETCSQHLSVPGMTVHYIKPNNTLARIQISNSFVPSIHIAFAANQTHRNVTTHDNLPYLISLALLCFQRAVLHMKYELGTCRTRVLNFPKECTGPVYLLEVSLGAMRRECHRIYWARHSDGNSSQTQGRNIHIEIDCFNWLVSISKNSHQ